MSEPKFFALIIGTEILNRRRKDSHFNFLSQELLKRSYRLSGSFIIEDDPALIVQSLKFLASQPNSVIFSFGGIGSTPDDYTRKASAIALRDGELIENLEAKEIIQERLKIMKVPNPNYPLKMAELPKGAKLLKNNPINQMPGFYLDDRYFFTPGFPKMAHPMVLEALDLFFPPKKNQKIHRTLTMFTRESAMIDWMERLPKEIELSSLPRLSNTKASVVISLSSTNKQILQEVFDDLIETLKKRNIEYSLGELTHS